MSLQLASETLDASEKKNKGMIRLLKRAASSDTEPLLQLRPGLHFKNEKKQDLAILLVFKLNIRRVKVPKRMLQETKIDGALPAAGHRVRVIDLY